MIPHELGPDPTSEDFNSGKNAIGTGPYRFVSYKPGDRITMERFDEYWGARPHWKQVDYRIISNDAARTAALLAGDVGIIEFVPPAICRPCVRTRGSDWPRVVSNRSIYLWLDHARDTATPFVSGPNGEVAGDQSSEGQKVRQALSQAINRQAIVDRVMEGPRSRPGSICGPGS